MSEELKTLNETIELCDICKKYPQNNCNYSYCRNNKKLKAEAIKEIKSLEEGKWKDVPKCFMGLGGRDKKILYDYIKWKNNLTEEDLQEEK